MSTPDRSVVAMETLFKAIRAVKAKHPDLRVGQILVNACGESDLFYKEDLDLAELTCVLYMQPNLN